MKKVMVLGVLELACTADEESTFEWFLEEKELVQVFLVRGMYKSSRKVGERGTEVVRSPQYWVLLCRAACARH